MEREELIRRLDGNEWNDIEFKEAQRNVPKDAFETVSAFANTKGGHLVFGVKQSKEDFEVVGVLSIDKVQGDFLTALRQSEKISANLEVREVHHRLNESDLLVFYVPEAARREKPVYLNGDIRRSFVRKGGSDVRCSPNERDRFLIDASAQRFDGQAAERDLDNAFDPDSIRWYREIYEKRGNRSHANRTDSDFLDEMGLLVERDDRKRPTHAAILLFGSNAAFRQLLPRPVVDCQRFAFTHAEADTGMRWRDRTVLDENLIRTWRAMVDWYERFAERPFRIDPASLQRDDTPPDYVSYRESMINLLIHQDYSDHTRKAEFRHYTDRIVFSNPGDAFASAEDLIEPGEKEVRNPRIVTAFRRIGLSENAGWGLRDICRNWQKLGNILPQIVNDEGRKHFTLVLLKEQLLSDRQRIFQARLGVHLTDEQARAFAFVCRYGEATLPLLKAVTGLPQQEAAAVSEKLATQKLIERTGNRYALAEPVKERLGQTGQASDQVSGQVGDQGDRPLGNLVTAHVDKDRTDQASDQVSGQVGDQGDRPPGNLVTAQVESLTELSDTHWMILEHCDVPRRLTEIMTALGVANRSHFKKRYLNPLIHAGIVAMIKPDKPRASDQRYVVTHTGAALKAGRVNKG